MHEPFHPGTYMYIPVKVFLSTYWYIEHNFTCRIEHQKCYGYTTRGNVN